MNKKPKSLSIVLLAGLMVACQNTGHDTDPDLQFIREQAFDTPVNCQYMRHSEDGQHRADAAWYLFRETGRVESFDEGSQQSQIWEKDQNGLISEMRVFHGEKLVLEVSNGDLLVSGHLPKWETVWSMLDPEELSKTFKSDGSRLIKGVAVERFKALVNGVDTTVEWLAPQLLPIYLKRASEKGVDEVRLVDCRAPGEAPVKATTNQQLLDYRHIDFSDLGDMESDPQVQRIAKLLGHGHDHERSDHSDHQ